jgi:hypothetical protein
VYEPGASEPNTLVVEDKLDVVVVVVTPFTVEVTVEVLDITPLLELEEELEDDPLPPPVNTLEEEEPEIKYLSPLPVGEVMVIDPVPVEQVVCTTFNNGLAGNTGCAFTTAAVDVLIHPLVFLTNTL